MDEPYGKIPKPKEQEACATGSAKGCGDPNCPICMPAGRPQDAGGALMGGGGSEGVPNFTIEVGTIDLGADDSPMTAERMRAAMDRMTRDILFSKFGRVDSVIFTEGADKAPLRDPAKERAQREEAALRPKVERFFLKTKHSIEWGDVIGNEDARRALVEAIEHPIQHKELFAAYRKKPTNGVLLYGPPGCGKTMFGKAASSVLAKLHGRSAGEHTMIHVKGPEIQSPYIGVTEAVIRDIFAYARAYRTLHGYPLVVFIDEADAILPSRDGNGARRALPWEESNVATFLTEMDGLEESGALVILATNRPQSIDAALLRDGRCDRKIKVERPSREAVRTIFMRSLASVPLSPHYGADAIADFAVQAFFSPHRRLLKVQTDKGWGFITLGDIVNGAMAVGVVEQAKGSAFHRDLASGGTPSGIRPEDMEAAIDAVLKQNTGLNHYDALAEYCERSGARLGQSMPLNFGPAAVVAEGTDAIN